MSKAIIVVKDKQPLDLSLIFDDETGTFESRLDFGTEHLQAVACVLTKEDARELAVSLLAFADS